MRAISSCWHGQHLRGVNFGEFFFHHAAHFFFARLMHENFNPRFIRIIAPPEHIINAHHRFQIGEQLCLWHKVSHFLGDKWGAALAAADMHFIADLASIVFLHDNADIVQLNGGAVIFMRR